MYLKRQSGRFQYFFFHFIFLSVVSWLLLKVFSWGLASDCVLWQTSTLVTDRVCVRFGGKEKSLNNFYQYIQVKNINVICYEIVKAYTTRFLFYDLKKNLLLAFYFKLHYTQNLFFFNFQSKAISVTITNWFFLRIFLENEWQTCKKLHCAVFWNHQKINK